MAKEDKRKKAAREAEAEADETVDLFRGEKDSAENEPAPDSPEAVSGETADAAEGGEPEAEKFGSEAETDAVNDGEATADGDAESAAADIEESDDKKKAKKDKRDEKIAELSDKLLRQQAEFINFRNRTEKEKAQMFEVGAKSAFEKILPVIDNFERGLATLSEEEKAQPFASGIDKTYRQLITALAEAGVTPIEAVGQPFDPDLHNAVMHVEDESAGENIVVEEFQKGYRYRDSVLRHSMVKVAN